MALFGLKRNTDKKENTGKTVSKPSKVTKTSVKKPVEKAVAERVGKGNTIKSDVILRPRITEKSGLAIDSNNIYTFEIAKHASKEAVVKAIKDIYKVTPIKIRTIHLPEKAVFVRGRHGTQSSIKKALVYLKKGDKIEIA